VQEVGQFSKFPQHGKTKTFGTELNFSNADRCFQSQRISGGLHMTLFRRAILIILILIVAISTATAQTSNGAIVGSVNDSTGAAIVGATVTILSVETGAVRVGVTIKDGTYRIESVLPGTYKVTAQADGFSESIIDGLVVPATSITSASLVLKVGAASDKVEVVADNALLDVDNGQISGSISALEISSLPIASLNPYELAITLPGVMTTSQGGFSNGVSFNVGGGRPRSNNFLIEGQDNNDAGIAGQGLQPGNDEAVKEVVIIENAYTAEFGHGAGSVSNLIYKSGSNQFHGSVYERARNSSLDAVDKYDHIYNTNPTNTKYRENLPGFTIGGPIKRNKAFFFASYEWDYYRSTANLSPLTLPDAAGFAKLKSLPSNTRINNLIAAYGGLVGIDNPLDGLVPIALGPDPVTGVDRGTVTTGLVTRNLGADDNAPELDLKGDYVFNEKDTLNLRLIRTRFIAPFDVFNFTSQLPGFDSDQDGTSYNAGIVETHVFNPKLVNEFRLSYGRIGFSFGLPASTLANPLYNQPAVSITNLTGYGIPGNIPQGRFHDTYQLQDSISWTHGKHFFKIGTDLEQVRVEDQVPFNFYGSTAFSTDKFASTVGKTTATYTGLANLVDDYGGTSTTAQNFGSPIARPTLLSQNYFAQDTWRPIPDLAVDFGLRYEYNGAPFNAPGTPYPGVDFSDIACFPSSTVRCNTKQQADGTEWGPRAGISFNPEVFGARKTVIRAGFGVFYDVVFTNIIDNIQASAPNAASPAINSVSTATTPRGTGSWYEQFANLNKSPLPLNTAEPITDHLLSPRTMHWNLGIQQELPWATTIQANYVGERANHLYGNEEINPYVNDFFSASRVIPTRGSIVARDNSGDSNYNGLWAELDHKINHDFLFRASYTYGRALDDSSEIFTFNNESSYPSGRFPTNRGTTDYGPSAYDHRQRLALTYIWQPSVWHTQGSMKILGNIVNHWAFAGITQFQAGSPENVEVGYDVNGDGISNDRPQVGNPKAPLATYAFDDSWFYGSSHGTLCSGPSLWYTNNPCEVVTKSDVHWIISPYGQEVTSPVGRNTLVTPGWQQWDINLQRSFKLRENATIDFRSDLFNAFNHGYVGASNGDGPSVANTSLISGIPTDAFTGPNGTNTFADYALNVGGHRNAQFFIRIRF
jgi:hypothetical protein